MDVLATERHFVDHLAPVWDALPAQQRGRFLVDPQLVAHAASLGIEATPVERATRPLYPRPNFGGPPLLVASYGDIKVGRRMGYGPFVFIEHGAGQSYAGSRGASGRNGSYAGGEDREDVGLFLVPNQHSADRFGTVYPDARVEIVGSPRLDTLPAREAGPGPVVCISFHWNLYLCPETSSAFGEYRRVLGDLAARFTTIGHAHPRADWPRQLARQYAHFGIPFVAEFADVCRMADIYVCDNSSTIFEFAATGRPVVVLNSKAYRRNVDHGLRFWEAADVGLQVERPEDLVAAVESALEDAPARQRAREDALAIVYAHRSGAAQRAAQAIVAWSAVWETAAQVAVA